MEFSDIQIIQKIEEVFSPAQDWNTCAHTLTTLQVGYKISKKFPDLILAPDHLHKLLEQMHVPYELNEHNLKFYWLLNDSVF